MTLKELETRIVELEKTVAELKAQVGGDQQNKEPWWRREAGKYANDPVHEEIMRLGKEYRESLHPDYKKKKKKLTKQKSMKN